MMFNDKLILISYETVLDDILNSRQEPFERVILCNVRSSTRNEFYNYGLADLRPEFVVTVNTCEYFNETDVRFRGQEYKVTRIYELNRDLTELTLSRKIK